LLLAVVLVGATLWVSIQLPIPAPPRRIVLASGPEFGLYHQHALRYRELLARNGIEVELRRSSGAGENIELLLDPASGVDVAFVQGGLKQPPRTDGLVMLISLYYEPLWIFHRVSDTPTEIRELKGRRISNGSPGTGTHASTEPLLLANGLDVGSTPRVPLNGPEALAALRRGDVDVMFYVGGVDTPFVRDALNDPALKLMSLPRAEAYAHRWPHVSRLTLSEGTIDLERNLPQQQVSLIGTKAMLAARDGLHPALINLLVDAAREIHAEQDEFKAAGEFPNTAPVDLRVSLHADNYRRYGASAFYNYLPFWVAAFLERAIILLVPMLAVLLPLLANALAHLSLVRRTGAARARCRLRAGPPADRQVAARPRSYRACRRRRAHTGLLRERSLYAARPHRPCPSRGARSGQGRQHFTWISRVQLKDRRFNGTRVGIMDVYLYGPDLSRMLGLTEIPDISSNRKLTPVRCLQNLSAIRQFNPDVE
jgi:TRAP-type uncharacterized transport system substrate-binding protein